MERTKRKWLVGCECVLSRLDSGPEQQHPSPPFSLSLSLSSIRPNGEREKQQTPLSLSSSSHLTLVIERREPLLNRRTLGERRRRERERKHACTPMRVYTNGKEGREKCVSVLGEKRR